VVVQRHRLDPELLAELAHAQGVDAALIGKDVGGEQHALPAQAGTGL
jgi:hypothetical protein